MSTEPLITRIAELCDPAQREGALQRLTHHLGVSRIRLFGKDSVIGCFLPALGLPQIMRQGLPWIALVEACAAQPERTHTATVGDESIQAIADPDGHCVLAMTGALPAEEIARIAPLLGPLGLKLIDERRMQSLESELRSANQLALRADALNKTLDVNRRHLLEAYQRAETELYQRRLAESHLVSAMEVSQTIMHYSLDVIGLFDGEGRIKEISQSVSNIWGYASEEVVGHRIFDYLLPEDMQITLEAMKEIRGTASLTNFENRYLRKDGAVVYMLWNATGFGDQGQFMAIGRDITAIKQTSMRLEESEQRFRSLFEHHSDAIFARDLNGRFIESNHSLLRLTQYSPEELKQLNNHPLVIPQEQERNASYFDHALNGIPQTFRSALERKDGSVIEVDIAYVPTVVKQSVVGVYGIIRDITAAANYERHIAYLATHDELTGLPNRTFLADRLRRVIEQSDAPPFGILFMDLNRFKMVNDSLGHDKGDLLLQMTAERLRHTVREGDTVVRLGGDEFVVVLENIESTDSMAKVAESLLQAVAQPFQLGGHELTISTSIGGSLYPKDGTDAATLLKHADLAMYHAKRLRPGSFRFFDPAMNIQVLEQLLTESGLKRALDRNELVLYYQPRIDVSSGTILGVEALVRWLHPERGLIVPEDFIPMAEELGIIGVVGEWVLNTACRQNQAWQDAGLIPVKMSVNISAFQISESGFADILQRGLESAGLNSRWLELEITETSLMKNLDASLVNLQKAKKIGVSISIDDFGTGYSSLAYLKKLPIDTLKIDKSFIQDLVEDSDDATIVSATIALAHNMGLQVVAEGVTTLAQMEFLLERSCHAMQGYLFSRPVSAEEFTRELKKNGGRVTVNRVGAAA